MLRRSVALALCLAATSVAVSACSSEPVEDAEQTDDEILGGSTALSLVEGLPLDTTWAGLPPRTRAKLELQSGEKRSALQTIGEAEKKPELERTRVKPFEIGI